MSFDLENDSFKSERGEACAVIHVYLKNEREEKEIAEEKLEEAKLLCKAISLSPLYSDSIGLSHYVPATLIGEGNLDYLKERLEADEINLLIINHPLSPIQQRNLEKTLKVKVIDRTGLILEIFGARAQTKEGRLQVELAALNFQRSRLVRSWTHLERQRGGFGFTGGPGETQIEIDRRLIDERIAKIKKDLEKVVKTREQNRKKRKTIPYPVVALVGYTNAGKSTLFNRLTGASVMAKDLLFATLDPTMRQLKLPSGQTIILSDTVGFISDLPTQLIAAFRATLEEVLEADLILHVRDASNPQSDAQKADVIQILSELGINTESESDDPDSAELLEVLNKSDLLDEETYQEWERYCAFDREKDQSALMCSAIEGKGLDALINKIDELISQERYSKAYTIPLEQSGKLLAWANAHMEIEEEKISDNQESIIIKAQADKADHNRFIKEFEKETGKKVENA